MGDNSIARIYQFLSDYNQYGDWKADADQSFGNGDGTLIKTEVRSFLEDDINLSEWFKGDSEAEKKDLINKFWASIDSKTTGNVGATGISNKNALDANELEVAEKIMASTVKVKSFMSGLPEQELKSLNFNAEQETGWRGSVQEGIINKLIDRFKSNKNLTVEDVNDSMLTQLYEATKRKATADYAKYDVFEKNSDLKVDNYSPSADKTLNNMVERYIRNVGDDKSLQEIYDDVKTLVEAYADTANTNTRTDELKKYGYNEKGKLNPLQTKKLTYDIKEAISKKVGDELKEAYGSVIDSKAEEFITEKLKGYKASDYTSIDVNALADEFITKEIADIQKEYNDCKAAKERLKKYLEDKYENYADAIKSVFGYSTKSAVEDIIDKLPTLKDVEEHETAVKQAIQAADDAKAAADAAEKQRLADMLNNISNDNTPFTIDNTALSIANVLSSSQPVSITLAYDKKWNDQNVVQLASDKIKSFLNTISNALINSGYPQNNIETALKTTYNFYLSLIKASQSQDDDNDGKKSVVVTYYNESQNKNISEIATFGYNADYDLADINGISDIGNDGDSGYYLGCNRERNARDQYCLYLDLRVVLKKFISFINM